MSKTYCTLKEEDNGEYRYEIFTKKGCGVEDGSFSKGPICWVYRDKRKKIKDQVNKGSYVVHLNGGKLVMKKETFEQQFNYFSKHTKQTPVIDDGIIRWNNKTLAELCQYLSSDSNKMLKAELVEAAKLFGADYTGKVDELRLQILRHGTSSQTD